MEMTESPIKGNINGPESSRVITDRNVNYVPKPEDLDKLDGLSRYLAEMRRFPVPNNDQVVGLFKGRDEQQPLKIILRSFYFDQSFRESYRDCSTVDDVMVLGNQRLVISEARKFYRAGESRDQMLDLVAYGIRGLKRAVERFNYKLGFHFSTFAFVCIKRAIWQGVFSERAIHVPLDVKIIINGANQLKEIFTEEFGREPTQDELESRLSALLTPVQIKRWQTDTQLQNFAAHGITVVSLDAPIGDDGESTRVDLIRSASNTEQEMDSNAIEHALASLTAGEREVLDLITSKPWRLSDETIAKKSGFTLKEAGKIRSAVLSKLRKKTSEEVDSGSERQIYQQPSENQRIKVAEGRITRSFPPVEKINTKPDSSLQREVLSAFREFVLSTGMKDQSAMDFLIELYRDVQSGKEVPAEFKDVAVKTGPYIGLIKQTLA